MDQTAANTQNGVSGLLILPKDSRQAVLELIKVTQKLLDMSDKEAQALAQDDMLCFAILQDEKAFLSERYGRLSEEFRERIGEFHGTDKNMLDRLENLQKLLGEKTRQNNAIVSEMYERSRTKTQDTLLAAQEIAQNVRVKFPENKTGETS